MTAVIRLAEASLAALTMSGCETPYKPYSALRDGGYSAQLVGPHTWRVRFKGNERTSQDRSADLALLRAAELCLDDGRGFVRGSDYWTDSPLVGVSVRLPVGSLRRNPPPNGPDTAEFSPPVARPAAATGRELRTPISDLTATCSLEPEGDAQDAAALVASLRARYGIVPKVVRAN